MSPTTVSHVLSGKRLVAEETADILVQDKVIGWFQGRIEFGPRALGARSILASPILMATGSPGCPKKRFSSPAMLA